MMMSPLLDHYQDEVLSHMLADYQYVLKAPVPTETDGAEAYLAGSLKTMPTEFSSEEVSVYGVEKDSAYVDIDFPKEGVYISDSYAEKYRLAEGDTIELKETYGDKKYKFKVAGIYEYPAAVAILCRKRNIGMYLTKRRIISMDISPIRRLPILRMPIS